MGVNGIYFDDDSKLLLDAKNSTITWEFEGELLDNMQHAK